MSAHPLSILAPRHREREFEWVCEVLFGRWLGLAYRVEYHDLPHVAVRVQGGGELRWSDVFMAGADSCWLQAGSLPSTAVRHWALPDGELARRIGHASVPYWFGDGRFEIIDGRVQLPIDISGSAFFMLSRYEEAAIGAPTDRHGRFPGQASIAQRTGLALRPLVDEWLELMWWALFQVAPDLRRRPRDASVWVSCDVDAPYSPGTKSVSLALRQTASDLVNHRSPRQAARTLLNAAACRFGVTRFDPFDTFDWMLDCLERAGQRATFFFLSVERPQPIDGCYELSEPRVARLLERIVGRGHLVGFHGSYGTVDTPRRLSSEFAGLREAVARAGGSQQRFDTRQHYLRWRADDTARSLDALGFEHDSTLGYADSVGFRCGTCHAYPLFDLVQRRALRLLERPLVLMEAAVISPTYLGLGLGDEAVALMEGLRASCRRFGGEFGLLWHNSSLGTARAREVYTALVQPL